CRAVGVHAHQIAAVIEDEAEANVVLAENVRAIHVHEALGVDGRPEQVGVHAVAVLLRSAEFLLRGRHSADRERDQKPSSPRSLPAVRRAHVCRSHVENSKPSRAALPAPTKPSKILALASRRPKKVSTRGSYARLKSDGDGSMRRRPTGRNPVHRSAKLSG